MAQGTSLAYCSTGACADSSSFTRYGEAFGPGDTVHALVDLNAQPSVLQGEGGPSVAFGKNGRFLGIMKVRGS